MSITIKDIAQLCGFSKSTVSRVLMNDPNVKSETREKIKAVIKEHNYKRNEIARSMVTGNIRIILVIAGDIANYFYGCSVKEIEDILYKAGYMVVVSSSEYDAQKELRLLNMAMECKFAGVIMMTAIESPEMSQLLKELQCPVVLMNRYLKAMELDAIVQDNFNGAYNATKYLIDMGHQRILHLSGVFGTTTADDRRCGYIKALTDAGIPVLQDMIVEGDLKWEFGFQFARKLIEQGTDATALFIGNDMMALGFLRGWSDGGRSVPDDMSLICFDYTPLFDQISVNISSVGKDAQVLGTAAAGLLLERIAGSAKPVQHIVYQPDMRIRQSVMKIG